MTTTTVALQTFREIICSPATANLFLVLFIGLTGIYLYAYVLPLVGEGGD